MFKKKMENQQICNLMFEIFRVKEDRKLMYYEDQLSIMNRKYEKLKKKLEEYDKDYSTLLIQVRELVTTKNHHERPLRKGDQELQEKQSSLPLPSYLASSSSAMIEQPSKQNEKSRDILEKRPMHRGDLFSIKEDQKLAANEKSDVFESSGKKRKSSVSIDNNDEEVDVDISDETVFSKDFFLIPQPKDIGTKRSKNASNPSPLKQSKKQKTEVLLPVQSNRTPPLRSKQSLMKSPLTDVRKYNRPSITDQLENTPEFEEIKRSSPNTLEIENPAPLTARGSSSSGQRPLPIVQSAEFPASKKVQPLKYVEVIRKKAERDALRGFQCEQCSAFYNAQLKQGILDQSKINEFLKVCSRHKARWTPPETPEGFWDLTLKTPEDWKT